ncbi:TPA_asm: MC133L [Molluscum contagiosum virus]|uniref:MC133L n=1 Tax=Molluscum contagiosum virus TaxID=10279 RepID=A0A858A1G5_9POXV|nr:MC133 [Molluscum contagiosum virus subtype 1]QHW16874.1 MC133L [Molluscum contagiosum virus]QHW17056.1 MC133L [Molluscum contagiosum virus]QHW17238.1 MC133L [Molluscum contagiosum virus]DBA37929.1 TPA_asm: MC133L [Molluscum contagiosum virus]
MADSEAVDPTPSGDTSSAGNTGDTSSAGNTGDTSSAGNTGDTSSAGNTGETTGSSSAGSTDATTAHAAGTTPTPVPVPDPAVGVPSSIVDFAKLVNNTWNTALTSTICLHRQQRDAIRNVLRGYMSKNNTNNNESGVSASVPAAATSQDVAPADILSYPYMLGNSYYRQLMSYDQMQALVEMVPRSNTVDTVGKYVLYMVNYYMTVGQEQVSLRTASDPNYGPSVLTIMMHKILNRVYEIHTRTQCKYMFVGIPSYYWHGVSVSALQVWGAGLLRESSMKLYAAYLRFIAQNPRDIPSARLKVEYMGESWNFRRSVPEFAMEALCFRADDELTRYDLSTVRVYVDKVATDSYSYYEYPVLDSSAGAAGVTSKGGVPIKNMNYGSDISALLVIPPTSEAATGTPDPYLSLAKLITPEECGTQLTDEDLTPAARDESKDTKLSEGQDEPGAVADQTENTIPVGLQDEDPGADIARRRGDLGSLANSVRLIRELEDRVTTLAKDHTDVVNCCSTVSEGLSRLERHAETLRKTMLALVRKINVQTGRVPAGYRDDMVYE